MKRIVLLLSLLQLSIGVCAQYHSSAFKLSEVSAARARCTNMPIERDSVIKLNVHEPISAFCISGWSYLQNQEDSYVRVILKDTFNAEYLIYENYGILSDSLSTRFSQTALETTFLSNIRVDSIKIETYHANIRLDSIYYTPAQHVSEKLFSRSERNREQQAQFIVDKLNAHLAERGKTWRAKVTPLALKTYEEKKDMFGNDVPMFYGAEYYGSGIFVMPGAVININREDSTRETYVDEFDWRNRHGKNWMTSAKNQFGCESCWIFAAIGTLEPYINLYYNRLLNYDLSEQEIVSCHPLGIGCRSGLPDLAFEFIRDYGITTEDCFQYTASVRDCDEKCTNPEEKIYISRYSGGVGPHNISEEILKKKVINSPICITHGQWRHSMVLAGYKTLHTGDSLFLCNNSSLGYWITIDQSLNGKTAWLLKNSISPQWGDNGFQYLVLDNIQSFSNYEYIYRNIQSLVMTEDSIKVEDCDGDGFFYWGIGSKPAHSPAWAPDDSDGDDSDRTKGPMNEYGFCEELGVSHPIYEYLENDSILTTAENRTAYLCILRGATVTLQSLQSFSNGAKLLLDSRATLILDNTTINGGDLQPYVGSKIILNNGAKISKPFEVPVGVELVINKGSIE